MNVSKKQRPKQFCFMMSEVELADLRSVADSLGISASDVIRMGIKKIAQGVKAEADHADV